MNKIQTVTYIGTKNDVNGNPRRAFLVNEINLELSEPYQYLIDVVEEGYNGRDALKRAGYNLNTPGYMIETTPTEYKHFIRHGKELRENRE
jgi:hypothetical protein